MKSIRPSSDLRNHYKEISNQAKTERKPIFITVNGVGDIVILNLEVYEKLKSELDLLRRLARGEADLEKGKLHNGKETFKDILTSKLKNKG
jgi:prevent-host-death family protein